jgi:hypothetical protein
LERLDDYVWELRVQGLGVQVVGGGWWNWWFYKERGGEIDRLRGKQMQRLYSISYDHGQGIIHGATKETH